MWNWLNKLRLGKKSILAASGIRNCNFLQFAICKSSLSAFPLMDFSRGAMILIWRKQTWAIPDKLREEIDFEQTDLLLQPVSEHREQGSGWSGKIAGRVLQVLWTTFSRKWSQIHLAHACFQFQIPSTKYRRYEKSHNKNSPTVEKSLKSYYL